MSVNELINYIKKRAINISQEKVNDVIEKIPKTELTTRTLMKIEDIANSLLERPNKEYKELGEIILEWIYDGCI